MSGGEPDFVPQPDSSPNRPSEALDCGLSGLPSTTLNTQVAVTDLKTSDSSVTVNDQVSQDDLICFLSRTLDPHRTQTVQIQLQKDESLRRQAVALQSTWDLLDLANVDGPTVNPYDQAKYVLRLEQNRKSLRWAFVKITAFTTSLIICTLGWILGQNYARPQQTAILELSAELAFVDFLQIVGDAEFLKFLMADQRASVFQNLRPFNDSDYESMLRSIQQKPRSQSDWSRLRDQYQSLMSLPSAQQKALLEMAGQVLALPDEKRLELMSRLAGLASWYESLPERDRETFAKAKMPNRLNRSLASVDQIRRQNESSRKKTFTVADFNRPDFVMDLASVTAMWLKMSPQERLMFERRSRTQKFDSQKKNDRFRALAQALETAPAGTFPALDLIKNSPRGKLATKAETLKQAREKRNQDYLEVLRANPISTNFEELGLFLEKLPPWLVEVVDPLPPDEARRLLGILKVMVEHQ